MSPALGSGAFEQDGGRAFPGDESHIGVRQGQRVGAARSERTETHQERITTDTADASEAGRLRGAPGEAGTPPPDISESGSSDGDDAALGFDDPLRDPVEAGLRRAFAEVGDEHEDRAARVLHELLQGS